MMTSVRTLGTVSAGNAGRAVREFQSPNTPCLNLQERLHGRRSRPPPSVLSDTSQLLCTPRTGLARQARPVQLVCGPLSCSGPATASCQCTTAPHNLTAASTAGGRGRREPPVLRPDLGHANLDDIAPASDADFGTHENRSLLPWRCREHGSEHPACVCVCDGETLAPASGKLPQPASERGRPQPRQKAKRAKQPLRT